MAQRLGGLDSMEVNAAFSALGAARSVEDVKRAIDEHRVISSPVFQAYLRQEYLRLRNQKSPHLQSFLAMYDDLFSHLHFRAHAKLCASVQPFGEATPPEQDVYAPPWLAKLVGDLKGRLPSQEGSTWVAPKGLDKACQEIAEVTGTEVEIPDYEPLPGSKWAAVLVVCAACRHPWLTLRAYAVDLMEEPQIEAPLRAGQLNNAACPHCGEAVCFPLRVWIQEAPGVPDQLAALTCLWQLSENLIVYQPPPGTRRIEENDRILEIRLDGLQRHLEWREAPESDQEGALVMSYAVAYSAGEVANYLDRVQESAPDMPLAMRAQIGEISRKMRSRQLPLADAETLMLKLVPEVGQDWPLISPANPADYQGDRYEMLALNLIAEGVAKAQKQPPSVSAFMARGTAAAYLALGETGLAEAALARAEDCLAAVPADEPGRELVALALVEARADLHMALGRREEAHELRKQFKDSDLLKGDTFHLRLTRQRMQGEEALDHFESKRYAEALAGFQKVIEELRALLKEAAASEDPEVSKQEHGVKYSLSGGLANLAATLTDLAKHWDTMETISSGLPEEQIIDHLLNKGPDPMLVLQEAASALQPALPALTELFPEGCSKEILEDKAQSLLEQALALAEEVEAWEFAGVQSHRLILLLSQRGHDEEAAAAARKAVSYAARAGDHTRIWSAQAFLADQAMKRQEGAEALACLRDAARELIRQQIGLGHHVRRDPALLTFAATALQATELGADKAEAVMVAESLKAATTAAALATGMPLQPQEEEGNESAGRLRLLMQQREALRLKAIWDPDNPEVEQELERIGAELERERQALSLRDPRFRPWVDATEVDVSDKEGVLRRLQRIGPNTTLMGVLPTGDIVWTYALWAEGCIVEKRPWSPGEWESSDILPELAEVLLAPLDSRLGALRPGDTLIISTFDGLYHVPFCALPYRGEPLCKQVDVSMIQGIGILEACLERPASAMKAVLCVGEPERPDADPLPGALEEARDVAELFRSAGRNAMLLEGRNATVAELRSRAKDFDVLHFACHAVAAAEEDDGSRLVLAPDLRAHDSGELSEDRILTELLLKPGVLVNLAGCSTGAQAAGDSPVLGGLVPAFLVAGAGSVIGSLWPLEDAPAARFQAAFYRGLLEGKRPAASLAHVQRACMEGALGEPMKDFSRWAAYVVYGVG